VYGPLQRHDHPYAAVIPRFVHAALLGRPVTVYGDGGQTRDFTYISDVVAANLKAAAVPAERCAGKAYNIAGGKPHSLLDLLALLEQELGVHVEPAHTPPRAGDVRHTIDAEAMQAVRRQLDDDSVVVHCAGPGYIQTLDTTGLTILATECDVVIEMLRRPGDYLFDGTPIARVSPSRRCDRKLAGKVRQSMVIGKHRTPVQDLRFAFNQIAEIAVRAMSPALNDPFTALDCVNRIGAGIGRLAVREEPSAFQCDANGQVRLIIEPVGFEEVVGAAFTPVRNYSRESVIVTLQMLHALREMAPRLQNEDQRRAVALQAALIRRGADEGLSEAHDRQSAQEAYQSVLRNLRICEADLPPARQICLNMTQAHKQGRSP
jgi:uncharacterized membrane protein